jgi:hypothetical protein
VLTSGRRLFVSQVGEAGSSMQLPKNVASSKSVDKDKYFRRISDTVFLLKSEQSKVTIFL